MADRPVRWGLLATGRIARLLAADLRLTPGAVLAAVGSRRPEAARAFAAELGGGVAAHGSYADLVADPEVDVVYVASPHSEHADHVRLALTAGKHVLCEKPLTTTAEDTEALLALARGRGRFLMEALWTACHPVVRALQEAVASGRLGAPRHLHCALGARVDAPPDSRLHDPALGASVVLDLGVYPLLFAEMLLGPAQGLAASGVLADRGYDEDVAVTGRYPGGALATMVLSMTAWPARTASLATDLGRLDVPASFHHPPHGVFTPADGGDPWRVEATEPVLGRGYGNEVAEVGRCVRAGLLESPLVPHDLSVRMARQLDDVRRQVGALPPAPAG